MLQMTGKNYQMKGSEMTIDQFLLHSFTAFSDIESRSTSVVKIYLILPVVDRIFHYVSSIYISFLPIFFALSTD